MLLPLKDFVNNYLHLPLEHRGGEVSVAGVGEDDDDILASVFLELGKLQCRRECRARRDSDEHSLSRREVSASILRFINGNCHNFINKRAVKHLGDESRADSRKSVRTRGLARKDCRGVGLNCNDLDVRIHFLEIARRARQRSARTDTRNENIDLSIPGGLSTLKSDWYPFVMTFEANQGFRNFTGDDSLSLTILYNFPAFSPTKGCSRLYDTASPYYNSFYGAYLVQDSEGHPYGFTIGDDGSLTPDASVVAQVPKYDFFRLVLAEFGLTSKNAVFDWNVTDISEPLSYAGEENFFRVDATLTVNGASHHDTGFTQSYLQYGRPNYPVTDSLAPISMYGRLYGTYLEEKNTSLFFYIVAADKTVLEDCDREILSKSRIR